MQVFVTGAAGFIGLAMLRELAGAGHEALGFACNAELHLTFNNDVSQFQQSYDTDRHVIQAIGSAIKADQDFGLCGGRQTISILAWCCCNQAGTKAARFNAIQRRSLG